METTVATTSQKRAREIMGRNMFGVGEAFTHFEVTPQRSETAALSEISCSEATLEECRETHVLAAVFPVSILEIRGKVATQASPLPTCLSADMAGQAGLFHDQDWYVKQAFAKDRGEADLPTGQAGWWLVRKTPVANSTSKTWWDQQALLLSNEEVPNARVMAYTIIGHYLSTGERLFEKIYVRCSGANPGGYRVFLGRFNSDGLRIYGYFWGASRHDDIGLASARKSG